MLLSIDAVGEKGFLKSSGYPIGGNEYLFSGSTLRSGCFDLPFGRVPTANCAGGAVAKNSANVIESELFFPSVNSLSSESSSSSFLGTAGPRATNLEGGFFSVMLPVSNRSLLPFTEAVDELFEIALANLLRLNRSPRLFLTFLSPKYIEGGGGYVR